MTLDRTGSSAATNFDATNTMRQHVRGASGEGESQLQTVARAYGASHSKTGSVDVQSACTYGKQPPTATATLSPRAQKTNTGHFAHPSQSQIPPLPTNLAQARADPAGNHSQQHPSHTSMSHADPQANTSYGSSTPKAAAYGSQGTAIAPYQSANDSQVRSMPQPPSGPSSIARTPKPAAAQEQTVTQSMSDAIRALQLKVEKLEGEKYRLKESVLEMERGAKAEARHPQGHPGLEQQHRDQVRLLQLQVQTAEADKMRHLEENSSEKLAYETALTRMKGENRGLQG